MRLQPWPLRPLQKFSKKVTRGKHLILRQAIFVQGHMLFEWTHKVAIFEFYLRNQDQSGPLQRRRGCVWYKAQSRVRINTKTTSNTAGRCYR